MLHALTLHPMFVSPAIMHIDVEVSHKDGALTLHYRVHGDVGAILWPQRRAPERRDELWKHTCFEVFVQARGEESYLEFNFSPSSQWAAYRFDRYRAGMCEAVVAAPSIDARIDSDRAELTATLAPLPARARLGLSAIVETRGGEKSYWALAHPPDKPDFHHRDCFALEITPSGGA